MSDLMISENGRGVRQDIITQTEAYGNVSNRYVPIATNDVLEVMKEVAGEMKITGFNNANVRKAEKDGFQRHAAMVEFSDANMIDGTKMNMILFNSNDRSTSLKIFMGSLRAACSNQCVWGDQIAEPVSIRHTNKDWKESIYTLMDAYKETQVETQAMIQRMMDRKMSERDMAQFARAAYEKILEPEISGSLLDPMELNQIRRRKDVGADLWHSYNRIQEGILKGGMTRIIDKEDDKGMLFEAVSKTHKVTDTAKQIDFNRQLHSLALSHFLGE